MKREKQFRPDKIGDYFRIEWLPLVLVTVSGLIYNIGLLAAPWFEGRLAQCLADILGGNAAASAMAMLVLAYILVTLLVQAARFIKRFYVRRFANNINRRMKGVLYANLVRQSRAALEKEGAGELMTKAISDVDDCVTSRPPAPSARKKSFSTRIPWTAVRSAAPNAAKSWSLTSATWPMPRTTRTTSKIAEKNVPPAGGTFFLLITGLLLT